MRFLTGRIVLLGTLILLSACGSHDETGYDIVKTAYSSKGMVVSAHPLATEAGVEILESGGNAVDAAVAVQLALAVVYPRAGNLGGGGFMVYRGQDGELAALDYRERAPASAHRDMYLDSTSQVIDGLSTKGHLASGVPGTVAGLAESHARYGLLSWEQLVKPAIRFAAQGYHITDHEQTRLNRYMTDIRAFNDPDCPFVKPEGSEWQTGDLLIQPSLASTLTRIAEQGPGEFYTGETARQIVAEMEEGDGLITMKDLADYKASWREPVVTDYKGYKVISMPPSSSGGIALAQLLEMVEPYPLDEWGFHDPRSIHLMAEAERRVYADRATYLGDTDYYPVPRDSLLDADYLLYRMSDYQSGVATKSASVFATDFKLVMESFETTHLTVVDGEGNAVSITTTLNSNYGSKVVVDEAGFFLNNEMDDFSVKPGVPNQFGLIGAEANAIQPGKRMLSSMTPTIVERDGEFFMTIGTPGGSTIITSVFQVLLNVVDFGMTASEAVQAKRFHHQWLPDEIRVERGTWSESTSSALTDLGHSLKEVTSIGMVEAVMRLQDGRLEGAADTRGDDHAAAPQ